MKLALVHLSAAACPYRLLDDVDHEIAWANDFLDAQHLRQLSPRSLRAYAYDLLHFARWFQSRPQTLSEITESTLLDYVRHQLSQQPQPTPQTVNHRLTVIRCLYRFHLGQEIPSGHSHFHNTYANPLPGRLRSSPPQCRVRSPSQATSPRYPASVGRAGLPVLGQFSHPSRSRCGGPHVARRPAFVRNPVAATGGFEIGRCPATRSRQRQETAHCTASRRNHGGAAKLPSSGTAPDQLPVSVHITKGTPTRAADDAGWTPLPISPSSIAYHGSFGESAPISTYF